MIWSSKEIAFVTAGKFFSDWEGGKLVFDSRLIQEGDIFIALGGTNSDGHDFVKQAFSQGAAGAIVSRKLSNVDEHKLIIVKDTKIALHRMASYKRSKSRASFIAITGSVGKTSTKELLGLSLEPHGKTFISRANYNNFLGVPINLASLPNDCKYAAIEIGMDHEGEIIPLSQMVRPHICVITNIERIHISNFDSLAGIAHAKSEIFSGIMPEGTLIYNSLSNHPEIPQKMAEMNSNVKKIINLGKDSKIVDYKVLNNHTHANIAIAEENVEIQLDQIIGMHQIQNFVTALTVVKELGLDLSLSVENMKKFKNPRGRGEVVKLKINDKNITLIDDSYNAGPISVAASLKTLANYPGRKVAILGDMTDLGEESSALHKSLSKDIEINKIDKVICFGTYMKALYEVLPEELKLGHFTSLDSLEKEFPSLINDGDTVLIKGSYYLTNLYHFTQKLREGS